MSDNYGMETTLTMVLNDDDYNLGFTFNDTNGTSLDKQLNGKIDDFEQDITKVILEAYLDAAHKEEEAKKISSGPKITISSANANSANVKSNIATVDRLSELEKENQRLNQKIETLLRGKESKPENDKAEDVPVRTKFSRKPKTVTATFGYNKDVENILRLLGIY